jgi:hypothetical protein
VQVPLDVVDIIIPHVRVHAVVFVSTRRRDDRGKLRSTPATALRAVLTVVPWIVAGRSIDRS